MALPLYTDHQAPKRLPEDANTGLWYDKFCSQWGRDDARQGLEKWSLESFGKGKDTTVNPKKDWIGTVTERSCGDSQQLTQYQIRLSNLLRAQGQALLPYKLESDFVTGLGREHPIENGFAWHYTLGTPYLPGSSVKGMVRAWAVRWEGVDKATLKTIFGSEDDRGKDFQVGSVIFLDAIPTIPVRLKADVMTPHYGPYYQGDAPPADWHSPVPVPFLAVAAGTTFLFGVMPRRNDEQGRPYCETVHVWLRRALSWLGAGAKTAVGYGRFEPDEDELGRLERERLDKERCVQEARAVDKQEAALAQMPPLLRDMCQDGYERTDFKGSGMAKWLDRMEGTPADERREIAKHLKEWYEKYDPEQWHKPNKKNQAKIERILKNLL